jgi:hypothetical protein
MPHPLAQSIIPSPPSLRLKRKREKKRRKKKRIEKGIIGIQGVLFFLPSQAMVDQHWNPSKVTQGHLQSLTNQGSMMATELAFYHMPEDPVFPMPTDGYMVTFVPFYKRGFDMPSHRFHRSLLWHYGLELHNLAPSVVLHIVTFVTLCKAYMGIDPQFGLWNYFFCVWHPRDLNTDLIVSGGAVIHVKSGHVLDPYFEIPMPRSMKGWWKKWFYLTNDVFTPLPTFIGGHPIPLPSWGHRVARRDLRKLQPMPEVLQ